MSHLTHSTAVPGGPPRYRDNTREENITTTPIGLVNATVGIGGSGVEHQAQDLGDREPFFHDRRAWGPGHPIAWGGGTGRPVCAVKVAPHSSLTDMTSTYPEKDKK